MTFLHDQVHPSFRHPFPGTGCFLRGVDQALQNDHFLWGVLSKCLIWQRKTIISFVKSFQNGRSGNTKRLFLLRSPKKKLDQALQNDYFFRGVLPKCSIWPRETNHFLWGVLPKWSIWQYKTTISFEESVQNGRSGIAKRPFPSRDPSRMCDLATQTDHFLQRVLPKCSIKLKTRPFPRRSPFKKLDQALRNDRILRYILRKHPDQAYKKTKLFDTSLENTSIRPAKQPNPPTHPSKASRSRLQNDQIPFLDSARYAPIKLNDQIRWSN